MTDQQMMAMIKANWGPAIAAAVAGTPFTEAFVAALAANESSGNNLASRFESGTLADLAEVMAGRKQNFGAISMQNLGPILMVASANLNPVKAVAGKLLDLATSWGPTQIMGYQTIGTAFTIGDLQVPDKHFRLCDRILGSFLLEWHLAKDDFESIFRCWNTGRAMGMTTDPDYVAKGLSRMQMYAGMA